MRTLERAGLPGGKELWGALYVVPSQERLADEMGEAGHAWAERRDGRRGGGAERRDRGEARGELPARTPVAEVAADT